MYLCVAYDVSAFMLGRVARVDELFYRDSSGIFACFGGKAAKKSVSV